MELKKNTGVNSSLLLTIIKNLTKLKHTLMDSLSLKATIKYDAGRFVKASQLQLKEEIWDFYSHGISICFKKHSRFHTTVEVTIVRNPEYFDAYAIYAFIRTSKNKYVENKEIKQLTIKDIERLLNELFIEGILMKYSDTERSFHNDIYKIKT